MVPTRKPSEAETSEMRIRMSRRVIDAFSLPPMKMSEINRTIKLPTKDSMMPTNILEKATMRVEIRASSLPSTSCRL